MGAGQAPVAPDHELPRVCPAPADGEPREVNQPYNALVDSFNRH